ncbi:phage portal protein, partial [Clostridium butyricum]
MAIYRDRDLLDDGEIPKKLIVKCIEEHRLMLDRLVMLDKYYDGRHKILGRELSSDSLPNNKLVCNHAQYITDMATGYVFGCPVSYSGTNADVINEIFTKIDEDSHNNELALDMSVYGVGYELIYMNDEE